MFPEVEFGMGRKVTPQGRQALQPSPPIEVIHEYEADSVEELPYSPTDPASLQLFDLLRRYFGINAETFENDNDCRHAVIAAASECLMYGFFPGRHVRVRRIAGVWTCEEGYRAWLDCANQMAKQGRFTFDVETIPMTDAEVKRYLPHGEYTPGDCGYFARVLRSDHLRMYKDMGREYNPEWQAGFWKTLGYREVDQFGNLGDWHPDPIWAGRRPEDTAKTRASKAALMEGFSLVELDRHDVATRLRRLLVSLTAELQEANRYDPRDHALPAPSTITREPDGTPLWA